jgi:hypothetical protein
MKTPKPYKLKKAKPLMTLPTPLVYGGRVIARQKPLIVNTSDSSILASLIDYYLNILVKRVETQIRKTPKEAMITGNDSGLRTFWDELCVQVQDEHFGNWDLLDDMVCMICEEEYNKLDNTIQLALTYEACEKYDVDYDVDSVFPELVADLIKENVYQYAMNFENRQITHYLERRFDY